MAANAAKQHYERTQTIARSTLIAARRVWAQLGTGSFDQAWARLGPQLLLLLTAAQTAAARGGAAYAIEAAIELGVAEGASGTVSIASLVGVASDGRNLASLLYEPVILTRTALGRGLNLDDSLQVGENSLARIVNTQVADAGRAASSVGMVANKQVDGYVRMLNPPSCARCTVLAGRFYRWNQGFYRHPGCDCVHIHVTESIAGDLTTDPLAAIKAGQVRGLSKADYKAIVDDGADVAQVINAHRSMSTEQVFGRAMKVTREGITRNGIAGKRLGQSSKGVRLRPESIYKVAKDRDDAIRLLRRYGYLK